MYGFGLDALRLGCSEDFNKKVWQDISKVCLFEFGIFYKIS